MNTKRIFALVATLFALFVVACGAPSFESQVERYKRNTDKLDMLAAKQPQLKADIEKKKLEFAAEMEAAKMKGGEEGTRALQVLGARMETFEQALNPQAAQPAPSSNSGSKLGNTGTPAPAPAPAGSSGGKIGGAAAPAPAPAPAAGGSGFGGGSATPTPAPAPAPAPAAGGSGFGSGTATPTPAPAPAPAPATQPAGGSGFGGQ